MVLHVSCFPSPNPALTLGFRIHIVPARATSYEQAAQAWKEFEGAYRDDITVVVVYLSPLAAALEDEIAGADQSSFRVSVGTATQSLSCTNAPAAA